MKIFSLATLAMLVLIGACTPNRDLDTGTPAQPAYGPYPDGMPNPPDTGVSGGALSGPF